MPLQTKELIFYHQLNLLAQAHALAARTPVTIVPSANVPWHYLVHIHGFDEEHDQECGIDELPRVVEDALELSGYRLRMEQSFVDRIIEEYLSKQGVGENNSQTKTDQVV